MSEPSVTVIGAGIVGVCSTLWLQRAGFKVTLIDAGAVGEGASFGNAGNISPGSVVPYLIPGIWRQAGCSIPKGRWRCAPVIFCMPCRG